MLTFGFYTFFLLIYLLIDFRSGVTCLTYAMMISAFVILLLKTSMPFTIVGNIYLTAGHFAIISCILFSGGLRSPIISWLLVPPVAALLLINRNSCYAWVVATVCMLGLLLYIDMYGFTIPISYNRKYDDLFFFSCYVGFVLMIVMICILFHDTIERSKMDLSDINNELLASNELLLTQKEELSTQHDMLFEVTKELERKKSDVENFNQKLEKKVEERTEALRLAKEELNTFIYRAAHDIKGPLSTIAGLCYLAKTEITG